MQPKRPGKSMRGASEDHMEKKQMKKNGQDAGETAGQKGQTKPDQKPVKKPDKKAANEVWYCRPRSRAGGTQRSQTRDGEDVPSLISKRSVCGDSGWEVREVGIKSEQNAGCGGPERSRRGIRTVFKVEGLEIGVNWAITRSCV